MLTLKLAPFGPPRPASVFVPPAGMRLQEYALAYDEVRGRTVYVISQNYGAAFGDVFTYDGAAWSQIAKGKTSAETKQKLQGFFDPSRKTVVLWNFTYDYEKAREIVKAHTVSEDGKLAVLATRGELPVTEPEDEDAIGTFDTLGLFAFDRARNVTLCLTRRGVWALDAAGTWTRQGGDLSKVIPQEWDDSGAGGAWDPVGERAVFWMFTRSPYEYAFFAWDGKALKRLPATGLTMEDLHVGLLNPGAVIGSHAKHGIVLLAGDKGMFALDRDRWRALPKTEGVPPRMQGGRLVHDTKRDAIVVGPGYHENDPGGREQQAVFFVLRGSKWERLGTVSRPSPLAKLNTARHAVVGGTWYAVARHDGHTLAWRDGFIEAANQKEAEALLLKPHQYVADAIDVEGRATIVTSRGSVLELDGAKWKVVAGVSKVFGERMDPLIAYDATGKRIVAWGGDVKSRASNDVFTFADGKWTQAKKPSPLPKDKRGRNAPSVDFTLFWDGALGRVVRLGWQDVAVLEGDQFVPVSAPGYAKLAAGRAWEHVPLHDPKTGETLIVQLETGVVFRFDLAGCVQVATIELPAELAPKKQHDSAAHYAINEALAFDPASRTLHAQAKDDATFRYAVDVGPAFDAALKLGARKLLGARSGVRAGAAASTHSARLYHEKKRTFWFCDGKSARTGSIDALGTKGGKGATEKLVDTEKAIAAKKKAGFVEASALSLELLGSLAGSKSRAFKVGKKVKTLADTSVDRIGGLPSGIDEKRWPRDRKEPMGFLFQVATGKLLKKHAGVAVFCVTDGTATEEETNNKALLLTAAEWKKKPLAKPPLAKPGSGESGAVAVLAPMPLTLGDERWELDEERVEALATQDPALGGAFDLFQKKMKVQEGAASKLGGGPVWLQGEEGKSKYRFVAQLDFDMISTDREWGLAGCVYVFVHPEEKDAFASWQYT